MILALDKHAALHIFSSTDDAQKQLEAIDVQQDAFHFCDIHGQRFTPKYPRNPKTSRLGPFQFVDIGEFRLVPEGDIDTGLPEKFIENAVQIEHTSISSLNSIEALRDALHNQA